MNAWRRVLPALGLVCTLTAGAADQGAGTPEPVPVPTSSAQPLIDRDDLSAFVDGFVEARMDAQEVVGVTVSIVHDGELIFARGYGYDDLEAGRAVAADRSLFRPGSISKTFTWTAVMQLVEQGKLDLDEDIQTYLPNLSIADTFNAPITMRHLMAHTPGYEDSAMGHLFGNDPDRVLPLAAYLNAYRPARVRPPGVAPAYSNYGVGVAGLIVANVSGMAWEDYVEQHLLVPLGMHDSTFREPWTRDQPAPMPARLRDNVSKGYVRRGGDFHAGSFAFIGQIGPAGALSATATDMARWMLVHLNDGRLGDVRILSQETAQRMHSQHFSLDPHMPGMAHGFIESHPHGYRAIGHGGGTVHFLSDMQLVPELDVGVFISTNTTGGGGELISRFVPTLLARYFPPGPLAIARPRGVEAGRPLAEYAGTYLASRRAFTTVEAVFTTAAATIAPSGHDALVVSSPLGQNRLEPLGGDAFRSVDTGERVAFTTDAEGNVNALLLSMPTLILQKVGPLQTAGTLSLLVGLAAFVMAGTVVGAWLRRRQATGQTTAEAWAARLVVVTAVGWLGVYALGLVAAEPLGADFANVFYDFPSTAFVSMLAVVLLAAGLTVLSVLLLYPVWRTGSWPLWRRLRHTGVVLAASVTLLVFWHFNAIGFNYLPN